MTSTAQHTQVVQKQFGEQAAAYLSSAVHAQGTEFALLQAELAGQGDARVLDLGTGSGAVALALQHQRPDAEVHAVDASPGALAVAQGNAQRLGLAVRFWAGSWFQPLPGGEWFDAIVSNPPYVAEGDPHLATLTHEPLQALTSGPDGLDDIRQIIAQAPTFLSPGGWLLLEHGWDQAAPVQALLREAGLVQVQSRRDLGDIERCTGAAMPK